MKNKGFTLVELLGVLVIFSIILAIVFPTVTSIISESKDTIDEAQVIKILNSTYDYTLKNTGFLPDYNKTNYIILNQLKKEGLIDSDIKQTNTNEEYPNNLVVSIKNVGSSYKNTNVNSKLSGNYLYTVEFDFMETEEFKTNKPTITIDSESLISNINIGEEFVYPEYTAISSEDEDITEYVSQNITINSKNTDKIDTKKAGIYYINYCVVDVNGYSDCAVMKVIVSDLEPPTLSDLDSLTISTSATSLDLMKDVSCSDNSGDCKITTKGSVSFGVVGDYPIEYIATDPTGNTTSQKRVITVE